jgi:hypothetical protein
MLPFSFPPFSQKCAWAVTAAHFCEKGGEEKGGKGGRPQGRLSAEKIAQKHDRKIGQGLDLFKTE